MAKLGNANDSSMEASLGDDPPEEEARRAFNLLYPSLYRFFVHRGLSPEECRDLTQETLLRVFRGMEDLRGEAGIKTWVYTIAANVYREKTLELRTKEGIDNEVSLEKESSISGQQDRTAKRPLTAEALLKSGLVGMWEARKDLGSSGAFARRLREEALRGKP